MKRHYVMTSNLKSLMEKEGISANKLADLLHERRATLNDLVANRNVASRRIPATLLAKLCVYFEAQPSDIFSIEEVDNVTDEDIVIVTTKIEDGNLIFE